ncbi:MAG: hypothetical protein II055_04695 [Prevotella sp.]|nr:hypothetical protein [Prevotella sp.]
MHNSITNNLIALLKAGAFNDTTQKLEPMSPYKWRMLCKAAETLNVLGYVAMGAPQLGKELDVVPFQREYPLTDATLFNHWSDKHLMEVREEEMNAPDTSDETLLVLDTIVANAHTLITSDVSIEGIIALGRLLRQQLDSIDANKLTTWLHTIGLVQVANLEANILIDFWGFKPEEIPFYRKPYPKAGKLYHLALSRALEKNTFSMATRLNIAMIETISYNFINAISTVTDIEE